MLKPLHLPPHPDPDMEAAFEVFRSYYFFNIHSALHRDIYRLICTANGNYLRPDHKTSCFRLKCSKGIRKVSIHWLVLMNCYPDRTPPDIWYQKDGRKGHHKFSVWTVDHINNIHNDHHPDNLRWMTRAEHSKLPGRAYTDFDKQIHTSRLLEDGEVELYLDGDIFRRCAKKYECEDLKYIRVTNRGRIRMKSGKYNRGYLRYFRKHDENGVNRRYLTCRYRRVKIGKKEFSVHVLIMMAKLNAEIPRGYVVMHNDSIPDDIRLDSEGAERNWVDDLSIGTTSENSLSYHMNKWG